MALPSVDFELLYWRARRRTQRLRGAIRATRVRIRSDLQLRWLHLTGTLAARPSPEETAAWRAMWCLVLAGFCLVLTAEVVGEEAFLEHIEAALSLLRRS